MTKDCGMIKIIFELSGGSVQRRGKTRSNCNAPGKR